MPETNVSRACPFLAHSRQFKSRLRHLLMTPINRRPRKLCPASSSTAIRAERLISVRGTSACYHRGSLSQNARHSVILIALQLLNVVVDKVGTGNRFNGSPHDPTDPPGLQPQDYRLGAGTGTVEGQIKLLWPKRLFDAMLASFESIQLAVFDHRNFSYRAVPPHGH